MSREATFTVLMYRPRGSMTYTLVHRSQENPPRQIFSTDERGYAEIHATTAQGFAAAGERMDELREDHPENQYAIGEVTIVAETP